MSVTRSLVFLWTPWSAAAGAVAVAATAALGFVAWRRSGYRRALGGLELLRLLFVAAAALLLNQPEWVEEYRPEEKPTIAVLCDASTSMETKDVVDPGNPGVPPASRRSAIAPLEAGATWGRLRDRFQVVVQPFSSPEPGRGTDLGEPLRRVAERAANLRAVVLASDGDWNEGEPPGNAAAGLRLRGVPVFGVAVGSRTRLPDVEVLSLDAPTFGIAGKSVRIPFTIESSLPREYQADVRLIASDGATITRAVRIAPMARTTDWVVWKPKETGEFRLTLEVPRHGDEILGDNNRLKAPISIREEKLRVLIVESTPRWEYRYLRNALSRDPGVALACLLFHPGLSRTGGGNKDYLPEFPHGLDELSRYDVVFLGDVGVDDNQLTLEDCRRLKGLVEHQASGLVLMPGGQGRQFSLRDTALGNLFPVDLDGSQAGGWGSRTPNHFELTESGRRSLLTKLADTPEENAEVWENLPGFQWYAPVLRARAGSEVLCVHDEASNEHGRIPLLATRTFGAGKVLFMGTDGAWRWRKGVEDRYHYRFWGQVVRWMAYQRNMAKGERMRFYYAPDQPRVHQTVALHAAVVGTTGEPLPRGDVSARIQSPTGKEERIGLTADGDEWGVFLGRYVPDEPGTHRVRLTCKENGSTLETTLFVQGAAAERIGRPSRPEVLEEIARTTRGKVIAPSRIDEVVRALAELPEPPASVRRIPLWCHPAVAGAIVAMLATFWIGRKVIGLI